MASRRVAGRHRVFMDASAIAPGEAYPRALAKVLTACRAVIVRIGPGGADAADAGGRRLERSDDWVRIEQKAPAQRFAAQGLTVPLLRRFVAIRELDRHHGRSGTFASDRVGYIRRAITSRVRPFR
jgi:hypothetical protein